MMPSPYPIEDVLPQRGAMRLLDAVLHWDDAGIAAVLVVPADGLFVGPDGVPAWIGIEYMAQAIAAWSGCRARREGRPPPLGVLLGSRRYRSTRSVFARGERLVVQARLDMTAGNGLGLFACRIEVAGQTCAEATVSVFEPGDPGAYLESGQA